MTAALLFAGGTGRPAGGALPHWEPVLPHRPAGWNRTGGAFLASGSAQLSLTGLLLFITFSGDAEIIVRSDPAEDKLHVCSKVEKLQRIKV